MRSGWIGLALAAGMFALALPLAAGAAGVVDGGLDPAFGTAGLGQASIATGSNGLGAAIVRQPDGKVIVGGHVPVGGRLVLALVRYTTAGDLDPTFGSGGRVSTAFWASSSVRALALQPDGRIVAAVSLSDGTAVNPVAAVVRYNADGSLDDTFGAGGLVTVAGTALWGDTLSAIVIQPDGGIVAAGSTDTGTGGSTDVLLVRLLADGTSDVGFGIGGRLSFGVTFGSVDRAYALTQQIDGKLVIAGYTNADGSINALLARITSAGTLDPTFGSGGRATLSIGDGSDYLYAVSQLTDGKLVAAGYTASPAGGSDDDFAVIRVSAAGNFDTTFGTAGKTTTQISGNRDRAQALIVQPDGKLAVAGYSLGASAGDNMAIVRYLANGAVDTTFGTGGRVVTSSGSSAALHGLVLDPSSGALTGGGYSHDIGKGRLLAIRYQPSGALDPTFSGDGVARHAFNLVDDYAQAVVRQADGKVLVVGVADTGTRDEFAVARFTAGGSVDATYGNGGQTTTPFSTTASALAAVLQPDGKLIAAGSAGGSVALVRYTAAGALDTSFGSGGKVQYIVSGHQIWAEGAALQSDGKLVLVGAASELSEAPDEFMISRWQANGTLDSLFGTRSTIMGSGDAIARAVLIQPDGRIVSAGTADNDFALARYLTSGSLDTTFGVGGRTLSGPGDAFYADALALAAQPDGKLVAVGRKFSADGSDFAFARYTANGAVDTSFGSNGTVVLSAGADFDQATAVIVQDDGKIVAIGHASDGMISSLAMVRLTASGSPDPTFGSGGILTLALGQHTLGAAILQQPDRHLLAAGTVADALGNSRFFVTRHLLARCGDGVTGGDEACDDGGGNGDGCDENCTLTACGNGIVTAGELCDDGNLIDGDGCSPSCETQPTHTPTATRTATPTRTGTDTRTPTITRTPSITATGTATATRTNTRTQTATRTGTATPTASDTPTASATASDTATPTASDTVTPTSTPTASATPTPTATDTATPTAADTVTATPTASGTPSATATPTALDTATTTPSATASPAATATATPSASPTPTATASATQTALDTATATPTDTASPVATATVSASATPSATATATPSATASATPSATASFTATPSATPTASGVPTASATPTPTASATPTASPSPTAVAPPCGAPLGINPCVVGGGSARTDCRLEFALPLPAPANGKLVCYEGDPACDAEPTPGDGGCTIAVRLCLNNADPRLPLCGAQRVEGIEIKLPRAGRGDAADAANLAALEGDVAAFGVSLYRGGRPAVVGVPLADGDRCGAPLALRVPLRVAGSGRLSAGKRSLVLQARWPGAPIDADRLKLQCRPSTCGDGRVDRHEQCDDGNRLAGDGCSPACRAEP